MKALVTGVVKSVRLDSQYLYQFGDCVNSMCKWGAVRNYGNSSSMEPFFFEYVGRVGKLNKFREIKSGFTRHYSDNQLIGRKIHITYKKDYKA